MELSKSINADIIRDSNYFNIEISPRKSTLVINASKKGIDSFLQKYSSLMPFIGEISFQNLNRPQRRWFSWDVEENNNPLPTDLTPYTAGSNGDSMNNLTNIMHVQFLGNNHQETILCVGLQNEIPNLIINEKGWQKFLEMLRCLRDESHWFYVTLPNANSSRLRFQLTTPYRGNSQDHIFKAIECIRLEPEEHIYLRACLDLESIESGRKDSDFQDPKYFFGARNLIRGNCAGLLLFSQWMQDFANHNETSRDILNRWNERPKNHPGFFFENDNLPKPHPTWLHLRKTREDSPFAIFSFEGLDDGSTDLYIFGNSKGFEELSQVVEEFAFNSDHEDFWDSPPDKGHKGNTMLGLLGPEGFRSLGGWQILGGAFYNPTYNPLRFEKMNSTTDIKEIFVNERSILSDSEH